MPAIIQIPIRTHENFGDSISKLIKILSEISSIHDEEIILDFSQAKILNPFFLCGLACVIQRLQNSGKKFILNHDKNSSINSYLSTIFFPSTFSPSGNNEYNLKSLEKYKSKTYIPLISFKTGIDNNATLVRENILSSISELLKNQLKFSEVERQPLSYFLDELTNNINDHSGASRGYVFAQFYPNSNYLDVCICDAGKGIYQSFLDNPKFNPANDIEAMQLALSGNSTKDRPEARGFGISTTRKMLVNGLKGIVFIWLGNTTFLQAVNKEAIVNIGDNGYFQGTFIALRLPIIIPGEFNFYNFVE
jgi:hypothetical protein